MFSDLNDVFYKCDQCHSNIFYASVVWLFTRTEGPYIDKSGISPINIPEGEYVLGFCACCGSNVIDFDVLRGALKFQANIPEGHKLELHEVGYCDACGKVLGKNSGRVTVACSMGDVECNSPDHEPADFFVNESEVIWSCCKNCGPKFDIETLRELFSSKLVKSPFNQIKQYV